MNLAILIILALILLNTFLIVCSIGRIMTIIDEIIDEKTRKKEIFNEFMDGFLDGLEKTTEEPPE